MLGVKVMVATKKDVHSLIDKMSDVDFSKLCIYLNNSFEKSHKRISAERKFVEEVRAAENSVARGNFVESAQLHEFLGV